MITLPNNRKISTTQDLFCFCAFTTQKTHDRLPVNINKFAQEILDKYDGHTDYKAMKPYIDITEKTKADAMKLIEDAWGK